jgi:hypothetical protein
MAVCMLIGVPTCPCRPVHCFYDGHAAACRLPLKRQLQ